MENNHLAVIQELFSHIREKNSNINEIVTSGYNGYFSNKAAIKRVFDKTKSNSRTDILARLALIDSMYSTQMTKRYYGLEELADALYLVSCNNDILNNKPCNTGLKEKFLNILKDGDKAYALFNYNKSLSIDSRLKEEYITNLFEEKYGIDKEGNDKGTALSLITKYAYFETKYKFPIYDSIVKEMYPLILRYCKVKNVSPIIEEDIVSFLSAIKTLRKRLLNKCGSFSFDELDCLLWTTGKILRGNMSLIFSMNQYRQYGNGFNIRQWSKSQIDSVFKQDVYLLPFMQFAKELSFYEQVECNAGKQLKTIIEEIGDKFQINVQILSTCDETKKTLKQLASQNGNTNTNKIIDTNTRLSEIHDYFMHIPLQVKFFRRDFDEKGKPIYKQEIPQEITIREYMYHIEKDTI